MSTTLKKVTVLFDAEGDFEVAVTYEHASEPATPGTKARTAKALRMAAEGLRRALEGVDTGACRWGGFGTSCRASEDRVLVERSR